MPPEDHAVPRFAAEPPRAPLPEGERATRLYQEFLAACLRIEDELGEPGEPVWFPDRTWGGRTYVPVTCRTSAGLELFGAVVIPAAEGGIRRQTRGSADVLLMTTCPTHAAWETKAELEQAIRDVAKEKGVALADVAAEFRDGRTADEALKYQYLAWDKVHLGPKGHEATRDAVLQAIEAPTGQTRH